MQAVQICKEHDLFEDMFRCYCSLGMLHHRQHDSSKALHMLGLALDVASRLEDKIQLSCEILINKAEVSHVIELLVEERKSLTKNSCVHVSLNVCLCRKILTGTVSW
jgi:hypothetical protein